MAELSPTSPVLVGIGAVQQKLADPAAALEPVALMEKALRAAAADAGSEALLARAGEILVPAVPATPSMGFAFGIKAFLAVVVAGPVTLAGTIAAGGILGSVASAVASFWSTVAGDVVFFVITLVALRAWPQGISERWRLKL